MDTSTRPYDLIIIGSGPAGYKAAVMAAMNGERVAIVEKSLPGGTCLNQGCVPKEALVRIAKLLRDFQNYSTLGLRGEVKGDFTAAIKHKNEVISGIRAGLLPWLRQLGIRLIEGHASFVDSNTIEVQKDTKTEFLSARHIIIATGSQPRTLDSCPCDGERIINTSDFMFKLETLPESMLLIGGGAVSCELAYALHQFGCNVSIIEKSSRLLNGNSFINERASETLRRKFSQLGITVYLNTEVIESSMIDQGVRVTLSDQEELTFPKVLVAIGRTPHTNNLNLQSAGIETDKEGYIKTNEYLETNVKGIYAIGDVKRGPMTANAAFHDAKVAASNIISGNKQTYNYNRVPLVIDTAIQIATVGLSEERAEEAGFEAEVAKINLAGSTKANTSMDKEGYIEVVHDEETGQLLGGTILGSQAGEMIHTLTAACQSQRGLWFLTDMSYSHPSWTEELENTIGRHVMAFNGSDDDIFKPGIYAIP